LIRIKITIQGEPDVAPLTMTYDYPGKTDEEIFANSANLVKEKLDRNLKININESITVYSAFIVSGIRDGKSPEEIQKNASGLLRPEQVMIGVPETLRTVSFDVALDDDNSAKLVLSAPIQVSDYILQSS
jgi:urease subunit gamma